MRDGASSRGAAVRRAFVVLGLYLPGAAVVWLAASWVRPVLALPEAFLGLLAIGLAAGLPLAVLLAWYYPKLGHHGMHPDQADPRPEVRDRGAGG